MRLWFFWRFVESKVGAHVALVAAGEVPELVDKLVLYEPLWPHYLGNGKLAALEVLAKADDWDEFSYRFFRDVLSVPAAELDAVRASDLWPPIVEDAIATRGDLRALLSEPVGRGLDYVIRTLSPPQPR